MVNRKKVVLYVQEFGAGFGHLTRLAGIAAGLKDFQAVFALPQASISRDLIKSAAPDAQIVAIPKWAGYANASPLRDHTLADAFAKLGYKDYPALLTHALAWQDLVADVRPDLVVADFAPTLRLILPPATPLIVVGNWYMIPPPGRELPAVKYWENYLPPASLRHERELLAAANAVRKRLSMPDFAFTADLFQGDRTFVTAFEGFDAYRRARRTPVLPPFNVPRVQTGPLFHERQGPHIFCYLAAETEGLNPIVTALNGLSAPSHLYVRGAAAHVVAENCAPQVSVHAEAVDFGRILPQVRLFIHYGGAGSCYAGLLAGVPQFMAASGLEQQANAWAVQTMGCGTGASVADHADPAAIRAIIEPMLSDRSLQARALAVSRELVGSRGKDPQPDIAAACREILGTNSASGV